MDLNNKQFEELTALFKEVLVPQYKKNQEEVDKIKTLDDYFKSNRFKSYLEFSSKKETEEYLFWERQIAKLENRKK